MEFEVACFGNLTIEQLKECKYEFLSMCDGEIEAKTIEEEWSKLSKKDFITKYPNDSDIWANDYVADRMHGNLSLWENPDPLYDKDDNYNWSQLVLDYKEK
jgi:hypothetical protein